ncbi:MAG TPA: methyltransferase, partial [Acetobacteraceae bacterium]|nr:methyltransferase [Acetobacteraceae bacterium]
MLFGHPDFWATWGALEHCVRTGETAVRHLFGVETTFERYAADPAFGAVFDAGMAVLAERGAAAVLAAWPFPEKGLVVDVGGGQGTLLAAVLRAWPRLRGVVLDLPGVAERAARLLQTAGLGDRASAE